MKTFITELLSAQSILLQQPRESPMRRATLVQLARIVPSPVLAHFLRLVEQGRIGVATVRHGVCSGCHLRIPSGMVAALVKPDDLHVCETCGSYLVLAREEQLTPATPPASTPPVTRRRTRVCEAVTA